MRRKMTRVVTVIAFVAFLTSCAGKVDGMRITQAQINALEPGKTTLDEIKELWGPPSNETVTMGELLVSYSYMESGSTMNPLMAVVPFGTFILDERGSTSTKMESVSMRFNKNMVLIERPSISKNNITTKY